MFERPGISVWTCTFSFYTCSLGGLVSLMVLNSMYRLLISFLTVVLFSELWFMYVFKCLFNVSMVIFNKHFKTKKSKTESFIFSPKTCVFYSLSHLNKWQLNFPNFSDQKPKVTLDFFFSLTSHNGIHLQILLGLPSKHFQGPTISYHLLC